MHIWSNKIMMKMTIVIVLAKVECDLTPRLSPSGLLQWLSLRIASQAVLDYCNHPLSFDCYHHSHYFYCYHWYCLIFLRLFSHLEEVSEGFLMPATGKISLGSKRYNDIGLLKFRNQEEALVWVLVAGLVEKRIWACWDDINHVGVWYLHHTWPLRGRLFSLLSQRYRRNHSWVRGACTGQHRLQNWGTFRKYKLKVLLHEVRVQTTCGVSETCNSSYLNNKYSHFRAFAAPS